MRIVIDTNVIVAGLRSRDGASFQILERISSGKVKFVLSVALFLEYESVLKRPQFRKDTGLLLKDINAILNMLASKCIKTNVYYLWRPQLRDPSDDMVLEAAISGSASAIVTFNQKDFMRGVDKFGVKLLLPSEFYHKYLRGK